ncbi:MAG: hypothetical protein JSV65_00670 [Armatimonadota bacterium]|nr:MAG: hypothetical protein JSV65_00670 [Armatimonadota bacterium]
MSPGFKMQRTAISLEPDDIMRLAGIITDQDRDEALAFVQQVIASKVGCAQAPSHQTAFEGDTGRAAAHYTQKGEGAHVRREEK